MTGSVADIPGGYLPEATIAKQFKVQPQALRVWRRQGKGPPFIKVGRHIFYRAESLAAWLRSQEVQPVRTTRTEEATV